MLAEAEDALQKTCARWFAMSRHQQDAVPQSTRPIGADAMTLLIRAELEVPPNSVRAFLELTQTLQRASTSEPGTLRYAWFRPQQEGTFVVLEEYTDPTAALVHNEQCAELLQKVHAVATMTSVQLHGQLGPELEAWVADLPGARAYTPLQPPVEDDIW